MDKKDKVKKYKQYSQELLNILNEWDPVGAKDAEEDPKDEYECFVAPILHTLEEQKGIEGLHEAIEQHATEHMGLSPAIGKNRDLEEKILKWWEEKEKPQSHMPMKSKIPDKRKVFVGVEIGSKEIKYGFVSFYGKLIHVELQTIFREPGNEAQHLIWSIRGIRGDLNLRFKNFVGICICFTSKENKIDNFAQQLNQNLNIPVYVEDRDYLRQLGEDWLKKLGDKIDLEGRNMSIDFNVIYGGAKLIIDKTATKG